MYGGLVSGGLVLAFWAPRWFSIDHSLVHTHGVIAVLVAVLTAIPICDERAMLAAGCDRAVPF